MTDINHRRKNRKPVNLRHQPHEYNNGYAYTNKEEGSARIGKTDYLDKSLHGFHKKSVFSDVCYSASIGNDFTNGHRGMAKSVKGAKKFVNSRIRHHDKMALHNLMSDDYE